MKLGKGSDPRTGSFVFLYTPENFFLGTERFFLQPMFTGTRIIIKSFKELENRKIGKKIFSIFNNGGINKVIEIEAAILAGEVVSINGKDVRPKPKENPMIIVQPLSVADELKKLSLLLKDSLITREEFEAQKKKLLGQ